MRQFFTVVFGTVVGIFAFFFVLIVLFMIIGGIGGAMSSMKAKDIVLSSLCRQWRSFLHRGDNLNNLDVELWKQNLSRQNCIAFASHNALVTNGTNKGVFSYIQRHTPDV